MDPALREESTQRAALAVVNSSCTSPDPFGDEDPTTQTPSLPDIEWYPPGQGAGVVISEKHILTAAHVVKCPAIPVVYAATMKGSHRMSAERDDRMFPHDDDRPTDVARLVKYSADWFDISIAPPVIREALGGESCCVETLHGRTCGTINAYHSGVVEGVEVRLGDSGSPIYCDGALVGIIVKMGKIRYPNNVTAPMAVFEPITAYWLEGM